MPQVRHRLVTYCTNIHPGESWEETFAALRAHVPAVKRAVSPYRPFPIGLRLSRRAALELDAERRKEFADWLAAEDCFVPTINGFPFGAFHRTTVKEEVYLPDWRSSERAEYTVALAELLAGWLPQGMTGSISTVPLAFKGAAGGKDLPRMRENLRHVLTALAAIHRHTGKRIMLALEPEPGCLLETTAEVCAFFQEWGLPPELKSHLGICYDCCHQAVQFEDAAESLALLAAAQVPIVKVQVSCALEADGTDVSLLRRFDEPCYLHQTAVAGRDGGLSRYDDIAAAWSRHEPAEGERWRCHFHLPIFFAGAGALRSTQPFLADILPLIAGDMLLEVETYTWEVLPPELRCESVTDSVIREIRWLEERLHA